MAKLPAAPREPRWLRTMIVLGLALLGSGVAYLLSGGGAHAKFDDVTGRLIRYQRSVGGASNSIDVNVIAFDQTGK